MGLPARTLFLLLLLGAASGQSEEPRFSVSYAVDVTHPESGMVRVTMTLHHNSEEDIRVSIPAWAPGAYRIVKYSKQVWNVAAAGKEGKKLDVSSADDQTWNIKAEGGETITISYDVTVDRGRMDKDHCFIAGPDTYFYVANHKEAPCTVGFSLPEDWKVGTGLEPTASGYGARDYDTFIDCPTELGTFEKYSTVADGVTYDLIVHAKGPIDGDRLTRMCGRIVREQNKIFGAPPFKRYVFLFHFRDGAGGRGLEHLNSTDIIMPYTAIKVDPYLAASVTSHEYFHLWNVKRIRPFELGPFDYTRMVRTKALWMCEGVTSYFGDRALVRNGIWKEQQYLDHLAGEIETLQNNPDRKVTPIEKASLTVWDRKDWPQVDYYNKGELLGLLMDLRLRTASRGQKTLDDVMRLLYQHYVVGPSRQGGSPIGVGYPEDGILKALCEVSGQDWEAFYEAFVRGVEELPFQEVLSGAGLSPMITLVNTPDLGVELKGTYVAFVPEGSEAAKAGLKPGDRISAVNEKEVTRANLREVLSSLVPQEEIRVQVTRSSTRIGLTMKPTMRQRTTCKLRRSEGPTDLQKTLLDAWLGRSREY